jgi:hypothetical protein
VTCIGSRHVFLTPTCHVSGFPWQVINVDTWICFTIYAISLLHFTSHTKSLLLSLFSAVSSHADWTWLGSLGLTALSTPGYLFLLWSLHVSDLTAFFWSSILWFLGSHTNCSWLSKCTQLNISSGLMREHLVQGFSLSSMQRWLAYSVAVGIQQFGLCCLSSFLGSGMPMYLLPLKYGFLL